MPSALVTGGSSGIGFAIARMLRDEGYDLTVASRTREKIEAAAAELGALAVTANMGSEDDCVRVVAEHRERFGGMDVLVNSAGIGIAGTVESLQTKHIDLQLGVNLRGLLLVTREAIPLLRESKGWIVNLASIAGTAPTPGLTVYGATKAAVIALTRSQNLELDDAGVRAVAICPGFVDTAMAAWSGLATEEMITTGRLRRGRPHVPAPVAERADPAGRDRARRRARPRRVNVFTVAERPDLAEPAWEATRDTFPEYNNHGDVLNAYWGGLTEKHPRVPVPPRRRRRARSSPARARFRCAGTERSRICRPGSTARSSAASTRAAANVLCAMVIQIPRSLQGRGLSAAALRRWRTSARAHGLASLIAPVRPSWKERYPLIADRAVRGLAARRRAALRPVAARARARRRRRSCDPSRSPSGSPARRPSGKNGSGCGSPRTGSTSSRAASRRSRSTTASGSYWEPNVWMHHSL